MSRVTSSTRARASGGSPVSLLLETLELGSTNGVEPLAQGDDGRHRAARSLPRRELQQLLGDDRLRVRDLPRSSRQVLLHDRLQIVHVVEEHLLDVADRRLDVARHGQVDDEQRVRRGVGRWWPPPARA